MIGIYNREANYAMVLIGADKSPGIKIATFQPNINLTKGDGKGSLFYSHLDN